MISSMFVTNDRLSFFSICRKRRCVISLLLYNSGWSVDGVSHEGGERWGEKSGQIRRCQSEMLGQRVVRGERFSDKCVCVWGGGDEAELYIYQRNT